jgi:hypothetical protein
MMSTLLKITLAAASALMACAPGESGRTGVLELHEQFRVALPEDFLLADAIVADEDRLVAWDKSGRQIVIVSPTESRVLRLPGLHRIVGGAATRDRLEIAEAFTHTIQRIDIRTGQVHEVRRLPDIGPIVSAVLVDSIWTFAVSASRDRVDLIGVSFSGETARVVSRRGIQLEEPSAKDGSQRAELALRTDGQTVVASMLNAPFAVVVLNASGASAPWTAAVPTTGRPLTEKEQPFWVALPTILLSGGSVQTIADLRSDTRLMVVRDVRGRVLRQTRVDAPIGFVAASRRQSLLFAAARVNGFEIIAYRWSWSGSSTTQRERSSG